jgi:tRNA pseudouridine38-40 synthase
MRNFRMTIQYDGARYQGWQRLARGSEARTIQGRLETVLGRLAGEPVAIVGASRTDAGVHAVGQVANFRTAAPVDADSVLEALGRYLPDDIVVTDVAEVDERFHARYRAKSKVYVYRVCNRRFADVLARAYELHVPAPLDAAAMGTAGRSLLGEHDFRSFTALKSTTKSTVRNLMAFEITVHDGKLALRFEGDGFLYNMIRIITGTLLEVGAGMRPPAQVAAALRLMDRGEAGPAAPPHGLCLEEVRY